MVMAEEPKKEVMLKTTLTAEFIYPEEAQGKEDIDSRRILQTVTNEAAKRLQPIFRALVIEIIDAQSKHYINPQPKVG